jgi:hypothetical protein
MSAIDRALQNPGQRAGLNTSERERLMALERENRELHQGNEIWGKVSEYFVAAIARFGAAPAFFQGYGGPTTCQLV